jgi:hypothetical protein
MVFRYHFQEYGKIPISGYCASVMPRRYPTSNHLARPIMSRVGFHYSYRISLKSIETISMSRIGRRSGPRV